MGRTGKVWTATDGTPGWWQRTMPLRWQTCGYEIRTVRTANYLGYPALFVSNCALDLSMIRKVLP